MGKNNKLDLSLGEDLSIAIMNLVSLEEHFYFTATKTGKKGYFDLLKRVRKMRKELLAVIVSDPEGEIWCISKHLLSASMRLIEVGTKYQSKGEKDQAEEMFFKAYNLYSLFWGINLKEIDIGEVRKIKDNKLNKEDQNLSKRLDNLVSDLIDCCDE